MPSDTSKVLQLLLKGQESIQKDITTIKSDVGTLKSDVGAIQTTVKILGDNVQVLNDDVKEIKEKVIGITNRTDKIGLQLASLSDDAPTNEELDKLTL